MKYGLLGEKLSHSYSPQIHMHLGNYNYTLFEKKPTELEHFLQRGDFAGINVTIPYKKAVIPFCCELTPIAQKLNAVNTIVRRADGSLIGHNTDYFGFWAMLRRTHLNVDGKKVLVLGSGGASATAVCVLQELGAQVIVISRSGVNNYHNLHLHADAAVIVNTTPVGMFPNTDVSPLSLKDFPNLEGVLDMIYNPHRTKLLMEAERRGILTANGLYMLVAQAKESAEWFSGQSIPYHLIEDVYTKLMSQINNLVLIGMPGSGKTTVGKILAEQTGKKFVDSDDEIVKKAGMSISDIFKSLGEPEFRKLECEVLTELGKQSGLVIATGGGCVTSQENYDFLHQNGTIIWLQRPIHLLPKDGRPLSQSSDLNSMYRRREPLYRAFSDYTVDNTATPLEAAKMILVKESLQ